jgi:phosphoglycolate phosphatase-like HAD superfamily hydrolase
MKKEKTILSFDWHGVIVDSVSSMLSGVNHILQDLDLEVLPKSFLKQNLDKSTSEFLKIIRATQNMDAKKECQFLREFNNLMIKSSKADKKLIRVLENLPKNGFFSAVMTNKTSAELISSAHFAGIDLRLFDYIQTGDRYPYHKPSGFFFSPLLIWAHDLNENLDSKNVLYFGDSINSDYHAIRNARMQGKKMKFVGVCSGIDTYEDFVSVGIKEQNIISDYDGVAFYLDRIAGIQELNFANSPASSTISVFAGNRN